MVITHEPPVSDSEVEALMRRLKVSHARALLAEQTRSRSVAMLVGGQMERARPDKPSARNCSTNFALSFRIMLGLLPPCVVCTPRKEPLRGVPHARHYWPLSQLFSDQRTGLQHARPVGPTGANIHVGSGAVSSSPSYGRFLFDAVGSVWSQAVIFSTRTGIDVSV